MTDTTREALTLMDALDMCGFSYIKEPAYGGGRAHWECSDVNGPLRLIAMSHLGMIASVTDPTGDQNAING